MGVLVFEQRGVTKGHKFCCPAAITDQLIAGHLDRKTAETIRRMDIKCHTESAFLLVGGSSGSMYYY